MNRRKVVINSLLGLALIGIGVGTYASIGSANSSKVPVAQTVRVTRGTLTASVTATGNAASATSIGVNLAGDGGTVTKVYVKEGAHVTKGQKLVKIDDTAATHALTTAKASLSSAEAGLETTTQGQTAAEQTQSNASIVSARTSLRNAETALDQAEDSYALDKKQHDKKVDIAEHAVSDAEDQKSADESDLSDAEQQLAADQTSGDTAAAKTDQTKVDTLKKSVDGDSSAITSAKTAVTDAKQTRDSTALKDKQSIASQKGSVTAAQNALSSQLASVAVDQQPARAGEVKSAQAQVTTATVGVKEAEQTLADTLLRAPASGTVASISAVVGESSGSSSSSSSGSTTSSTSSSTTTSSSSASSSTTGLVVLTDLTRKEIVASVAEADVTKVRVGQKAQVTFSAANTTAAGTVSAIDTDDTVSNNVVEYGVTVTLDSDATKIRVGQTASLTITTGTKTDAVIAPTAAITTVGTRSTVTRRVNNVDTAVVVQTGLVGTSGTEISSGLAEGDTLVIPSSTATTGTTSTTSRSGGLGGLGGGR